MTQAAFGQALSAALQLHRSGRLTEAETAYRKVLDAWPDTPDTLQLLGALLGQTDRLDAARGALERAVTIQPANASAQYNLAECLHRLGENARAGEAYRAALRARPDYTEAAIGLAGQLLASGDAEAAAKIADAARLHAPQHPQLLAQLGAALLDAGHPEDARAHLEAAVRCAPDFVLARRNLAATLIRLEDFGPALDLLRPLVNAEPRSIELLLLAGVALHKSGQHARAKPAVARILELDPDNVAAINLLGDIAADLGDGDLALDSARRAATSYRSKVQYHGPCWAKLS